MTEHNETGSSNDGHNEHEDQNVSGELQSRDMHEQDAPVPFGAELLRDLPEGAAVGSLACPQDPESGACDDEIVAVIGLELPFNTFTEMPELGDDK